MRADTHMQVLRYGGQRIVYSVHEKDTNRMKIEVHPDLRVVVQVPQGKSQDDIKARVRKRAGWIVRAYTELSRYHPLPTPKQYRSGESVYYLGRQYYLKVLRGDRESVKLKGQNLVVTMQNSQNKGQVKAAVETWYTSRAKAYLSERVKRHLARGGHCFELKTPVRIRHMKTRWGSCSSSGIITLNPEIIKAPSPCIDYVILHELCHLHVPNHSRNFYSLLNQVCPEWKALKLRLNMFG